MSRAVLIIVLILVLLPGMAEAAQRTFMVPNDHFLGISPLCTSLTEAREKALHDVVAQILRAIGVEYTLRFSSHVTGTADHVERQLSERFHYSTSGFLREIEPRIVQESYDETTMGVLYKVLVHFTRRDIERARRLSLGAKVHGRWINNGVVELREVNGVPVVLTEYQIRINDRHRHARILSFYVMKVSAGATRTIERALPAPVVLRQGDVRRVSLSVPERQIGLREIVLGTHRQVTITIIGRDQVGRPIRAVMDVP